MKVIHHNDTDGRYGADVVAQSTGNRNPGNYIEFGDYSKPLPVEKIVDGEIVWIVDVSISSDEHIDALRDLIKRGCDVIWIDHHESSIEMLKKYPEFNSVKGIRDVSRCGAYLAHQFCFGTSDADMPEYLKLIDDLDRHGFQDYVYGKRTVYFRLAVLSLPNEPLSNLWSLLRSNPIGQLQKLIFRGEIIYSYKSQSDSFYCNSYAYESEFEGYKCYVVNNKSGSDIFGDKYKEYPLLIVWVFNGVKYTYTLFAGGIDNVNCAQLAKKYGGGGHPGAAGFSSDILLLKKKD